MRLVLVAVGVVCVVAAGCGGVENEPNLAKAVERTEALGSTHFKVEGVEIEDGKRIEIDCTGAADYASRRIKVSCDYGEIGKLEVVAVGDDFYLRGLWAAGFGGSGDKWIKDTSDADDPSIHDFSPVKLLAMLRRASSETERVGDEDVSGSSTVRYRLTVDCERAELDCEGTAPVEVWIDDDGLVRRIWLDDDGSVWTFEFFDFGAEVDIEPPPDNQVMDEDALGSGGITVSPAAPCSEGEGKPISETHALKALRSHGFTMRIDQCVGGSGVVAGLTNDDEAGEALAREGLVYCHVHDTPPKDGSSTVIRRGVDGGDAELVLANLTCTILADSPDAESKIDPLEAAFEDLQRTIRP